MKGDRESVVDLAKGKWPGILSSLGIDDEFLNPRKHSRCPKDGSGRDRYRFTDHGKAGRYFCACSPDGRNSGFDLLMCCRGWSFAETCKEVEKIVGTVEQPVAQKPQADPADRLRKIMESSILATDGTAVWNYLESRSLDPPTCLREAEIMYWDEDGKATEKYKCMVARLVTPEGLPATLHVTYLDGGKKADVHSPRKMLPPAKAIKGGAVRLYPAAATMGVAEGIETALAAAKLWKIPVWSCLNADNLSEFVPPPEAKKVLIFGDNDANFTGHAAAYKLARRLSLKGLEALPLFPADVGQDWNDVLIRHETCEDMPKEPGVKK